MKLFFTTLFISLFYLSPVSAQLFKYIDVNDGLSDKRVLAIKKDKVGYMWFLTYTGIDRFDGKNIQHYRLSSAQGYIGLYSEENILKASSEGQIWVATPKGKLFYHDALADEFKEIILPPEIKTSRPTLVEITPYDEAWFCYKGYAFIYKFDSHGLQRVILPEKSNKIFCLCQISPDTYVIGTEEGVFQASIANGELNVTESLLSDRRFQHPQKIYYHKENGRLIVCSAKDGLQVYNLRKKTIEHSLTELSDLPITDICQYDEASILIATRGGGVFSYNIEEKKLEQKFCNNKSEANKMNGDNIGSIYLDENQRIWMAVYPIGITVYDKRYPTFRWYKNYIGNLTSIANDQINYLLEDSEGDIWFATNDGLSIYSPAKNAWRHLLTENNQNDIWQKGYTFLSLCEQKPGTILAGGYMTGIYSIDKKSGQISPIQPTVFTDSLKFHALNRFIRVIFEDDEGIIWTGGSHYLGCTEPGMQSTYCYPLESPVTCILQKDSVTLLVGTGDGLYEVNKRTKKYKRMLMPFSSQHINTMYLHTNGDLYIGTTNSGLVVLRANGEYQIYTYLVCSLLNNVINSILPQNENNLIIITEKNVAIYNIPQDIFYNWTEDQGLINASFSPRAGIHTSNGKFIFGSNNGAIEFNDTIQFPGHYYTKILIDQILVEKQGPYIPTDAKKKQITDWNSIESLQLNHNQNSLALHISSINYGNPKHTYFRWKLREKQDHWMMNRSDNWIRYQNLPPGEYVLHIQNVAQEDHSVIGEKILKIIILPSFWHTGWGIMVCLLGIGVIGFFIFRIVNLKFRLNRAEKRIHHFHRAQHGLKVSLSLIRASVKEVLTREEKVITFQSNKYLQQSLYSVENLYFGVCNLLNAQKKLFEKKRYTTRHSLNKHIESYIDFFKPLADTRRISLDYIPATEEQDIWIDQQLCDSIFYLLLSNAISHTPPYHTVSLQLSCQEGHWEAVCSNQINLQKESRTINIQQHFTSLNDELFLLKRIVKKHKGTLSYQIDGQYSFTFKVKLPKDPGFLHQETATYTSEEDSLWIHRLRQWIPTINYNKNKQASEQEKQGSLLIVSENREVMAFLDTTFNNEWDITIAPNATIALELVEENEPDIIIAGDLTLKDGENDLCILLKSNLTTNHIPIILITSDEENTDASYSSRIWADYYIDKLFDIPQIRRILFTIMENRRRLEEHLPKTIAINKHTKEIKFGHKEQDTKFLNAVREVIKVHIEDSSFDVDTLCAEMGMSRTSLYNKLKSLTELSPKDIIREMRMQHACTLLITNEHSISEVSDLMGFSEPKYFREVFKKYYGMNPSEYIKKQQKKNEE